MTAFAAKTAVFVLCVLLLSPAPGFGQRRKNKQEEPAPDPWGLIAKEHDKNGDGKVTLREYSRGKERFERLDKDTDGKLTAADFVAGENRRDNRRRNRGRTRRDRILGRALEARAPKLGDVAPGFSLKQLDGKKRVRLSSFKGKKPVALIFGSYT